MASRPTLDRWLASADEPVDDPVLAGGRLGIVPQERGRHLERLMDAHDARRPRHIDGVPEEHDGLA